MSGALLNRAAAANAPKHSDLVDDVIPVTGRLQLVCQKLVELLPHIDDAMCHSLDVSLPFLEELRFVEDEGYLI